MSLVAQEAFKSKRKITELVLTERCNLSCVYCYEHDKDTLKMSLDIAKKAVEDAFADPSTEEVEIDFFGGEPFAAFQEMKEICEWLWGKTWSKPFIVFATTNGTMVHGPIKEWVQKNSHRFILAISVDGTRDMHNLNRNNSFDKIDLGFFFTMWPFQPAKMTISRLTLPNLAEGIIFLHKQGFKISCNTAYGIDWEENDYLILANEMKKLADFYIENPKIEPCSIIIMPIQNIAFTKKPAKWCGAGTNMICIDRTGKKYPCHTFMPSASGSNPNLDEMFNQLKSDNLLDSRCSECILISCCPTCYGINYVDTSSITKRDKHHCEFSKIRARATAYMLSFMLTNKQGGYAYLKDKTDGDIGNMIRGIQEVNRGIAI